jgi:hypothetical protein
MLAGLHCRCVVLVLPEGAAPPLEFRRQFTIHPS